ncbi:hypothetical protein DFH11DRAFT_1301613 [Phellopilus nigrolimitatus]|nr:hypothetical protein DFH11DRAFT_1301613 [Phellopilus nigrolimitatus]
MKRWCVGPMPVEEFLDELLPPAPKGKGVRVMPSCKGAFNRIPVDPKDEQAIYEKLIPAINYKKRCPSLNFVDTSTRSELSSLGALKPDICAYDSSALDVLERELTENPYTSDRKKRRIPAHFGYAELFIEVKKNEERDPFVDPLYKDDEGICSETNFFVQHESSKIRKKTEEDIGQIVSYATEACARQHRMFYFSVSIHGHHARFIRWDRAGAVVTRSFNYRQNPKLLCDFLWRFGFANPAQRGYDPTVSVASEKDEQDFKTTVTAHVALQLDLDGDKLEEAVGQHYQQKKVGSLEMAFLKDTWRIDVKGREKEGTILERLNVNGAMHISDLFCHGDVPVDIERVREEVYRERESAAKKASEKEAVMMEEDVAKDTTMKDLDAMELDGQSVNPGKSTNTCQDATSGTVEGGGVRTAGLNRSTVIQAENEAGRSGEQTEDDANHSNNEPHNFIKNPQCTRTDEFAHSPWACNGGRMVKVTKHTHYRLLLKAVGYPLQEFTGTRELFDVTLDAFEALIDAHEICKILHRDVSPNNIILVKDPATGRRRGILIDWELSTVADSNGEARDHNRSVSNFPQHRNENEIYQYGTIDFYGTWAFMSAESLDAGANFRHSIKDDMESMLYVVLYCCVRWLPHNEVDLLGHRMHRFFDQYEIGNYGALVGGDAKTGQMVRGTFTRDFIFNNAHVQSWINTAYSYLYPISTSTPDKFEGKWTPESFKQLWIDTCREKLPDNDRVKHDISDKKQLYYEMYEAKVPSTIVTVEQIVVGAPIGQRAHSNRRARTGVHGDPKDNNVAGPSEHLQQELMITEPGPCSKRKIHDTYDDPAE